MSFTYVAPNKDPADIEDYGIDCTKWLGIETIATRTAVSDNPALVITGVADSEGVVSFRASGGLANTDHVVTVTVTSSAGRRAERSIRIPVRER